MAEKNEERRRYFRVMDHVGLRVNIVSDAELADKVEVLTQSPEERLRKVNNAINRQLAALKRKDESLAMLVGLLNHKLELLTESVVGKASMEPVEDTGFKHREVNISACGIAFPFPRDFPKAQNLSLSIKLFPSEEVVTVLAMVVGSERRDAFAADLNDSRKQKLKEEPYWIRANFEEISTVEQELLAQHVIQKQANELGSRRAKP